MSRVPIEELTKRGRLRLRLVVAATLLAACSASSSPDSAEARRELIQHLQRRAEGADRGEYFRTLEEALPNVRYTMSDGREVRPSMAAVVGSISRASAGRAFKHAEVGDSEEVAFDDPSADWRTLHLSVDVTEVLSGQIANGSVTVGLAVSASSDPAVLQRGLEELGEVFLLLDAPGAVFSYDPSLYRILMDGALLATVDADDRISFPVLDDALARTFLGELRTVADVRTAAVEPTKEIRLSNDSGVPGRPPAP